MSGGDRDAAASFRAPKRARVAVGRRRGGGGGIASCCGLLQNEMARDENRIARALLRWKCIRNWASFLDNFLKIHLRTGRPVAGAGPSPPPPPRLPPVPCQPLLRAPAQAGREVQDVEEEVLRPMRRLPVPLRPARVCAGAGYEK